MKKNPLAKEHTLDDRASDEGQHAFVRMSDAGVVLVCNDTIGMIAQHIYLEPAQALELRQWLNMAHETLQGMK